MKCRLLALICLVIISLFSCKKEAPAPTTGTLLLGKWYFATQTSVLYRNDKEIATFSKTSFTNQDFIEYYNDGSGYYSKLTSSGPSINEFTYTLSGSTITEYISSQNQGVPETIKTITSTGLSVHVVQLVPDPNDPTVTDTEIDDLTYTK